MVAATSDKRDTIVLGASAGGIEALRQVLPAFTNATEASVFVVVHIPADGQSILDEVLGRSAAFPVRFAREGEAILPRRVYLAPPDRHMLLDGHRVSLLHGARENHSRPAIDPLFRSAAVHRRGRVIGAVLSGLLDDGAAGLLSVKRCGGLAFIQADPAEADMPEAAFRALGDSLDGALPAVALGQRLAELVGTPAGRGEVPPDVELELQMLRGEVRGLEALVERGDPAPLSCPECGGPMWSAGDGRLPRYRCHTGHVYGVGSLLSAQNTQIETALWAAIKGLEQRSHVLSSLARDEDKRRRDRAALRFREEGDRLIQHADTLRQLLLRGLGVGGGNGRDEE